VALTMHTALATADQEVHHLSQFHVIIRFHCAEWLEFISSPCGWACIMLVYLACAV
jgi:hypothetical protein